MIPLRDEWDSDKIKQPTPLSSSSSFFYYIFSSITFPMLSQKSPIPSPQLPYPPIPIFWPWRSPVLGHIKFVCPMGLSFSDGRLGHLLIHMQLESRAPGYWLVHNVVPPIGLQTSLAPWVLSLAPPLGPCVPSNSWLWASTSVFARPRDSLTRDSYIRVQKRELLIHCSVIVLLIQQYLSFAGQSTGMTLSLLLVEFMK